MAGQAYTYNLPTGIAGAVSQSAPDATIEARIIDSGTPPTVFGNPVKIVSGKVQPVASGDAATVIYGALVRVLPGAATTDALGTDTVPSSGGCSVLKRGYITVKVNNGTASLNSTVYVRVANASGAKVIGGIEATSDSTNTVTWAGAYFTGPVDANGIAEIAVAI